MQEVVVVREESVQEEISMVGLVVFGFQAIAARAAVALVVPMAQVLKAGTKALGVVKVPQAAAEMVAEPQVRMPQVLPMAPMAGITRLAAATAQEVQLATTMPRRVPRVVAVVGPRLQFLVTDLQEKQEAPELNGMRLTAPAAVAAELRVG
jgi:hypothetical protein